MRNTRIALAILAVGMLAACSKQPAESRMTDERLAAEFADPSSLWRGKPFWAWNGKLEEAELLRQVGILKEMGFGGYFMHSRVGLDTEYLGEEWFDLVNAVSDEGVKQGMENYLYDEDRWPSGIAGGYVTMKPEYRLHYVGLHVLPKTPGMELADTLLVAFTCNLDGTSYTDLQRVRTADEAMKTPGNTVLAFYVQEAPRSNFYNGFTLVDGMNRAATDYFISLTHDRYAEKCGGRLGGDIVGIFTDEPSRGCLFSNFNADNYKAPWTSKLPEEYSKRFGGDLLEDLPRIFLHPAGATFDRAKWQYTELAQQLFIENFVIPQKEWCDRHHIAYTGHFLHEDSFTCQVVNQGSLMRDYEHQTIPGIDNLTQHDRVYWAAKQVQSVARQTGKKFILSELYGCSGWHMSFQDYKEVGDWQALFGVNLRCPHLSWYTMKGEAKRDYPASINFQSGWYKDFKYVEDYYSRLNVLLAQGQPQCDLLVINPIESVFAQVSVDAFNGLSAASPTLQETEARYRDFFYWVVGAHVDFDYGDEEMLSRLAKVGKAKDGTPVLQVGASSYKVVFVGNMNTMRSSTFKLLKDFAAEGGKIILGGEAPSMLDVEASSEPADFFAASAVCVPYTAEGITEAVVANTGKMAQALDAAGRDIPVIYCQVRKDGDRTTYVFMSMDKFNTYDHVKIVIPEQGAVSEWNCRTGEVANLPEGDIYADFSPFEEHVYVVSAKPFPFAAEPAETVAEQEMTTAVSEALAYSLNEPNVLPLDRVTYAGDGFRKDEPTEVLRADIEIRDRFGLAHRGGDMLQPWFFRKFVGEMKPSFGQVELAYPFHVKVLPVGDLFLCVESPEDFEIKLNGQAVSAADDGWWVDPCFRKIRIDASQLRIGKNAVTLRTDFTEDKNLEALYLIGDFGVEIDGASTRVSSLPKTLKIGDIVPQGLPFYSGTVSYHFGPVAARAVKVPSFGGACVKVRRSDESGTIAFAPYEQAIPGGDGDVRIDVVLTRRNTFGPLHALPKITYAYGPENFITSGEGFTDDYVLFKAGLLEAPRFVR